MSANQPDVQKLQTGVIVILAAVYILQMVTPLRLSTDTVVLLTAANSAARGGGLLYHGYPTQYPPGYPMLIAVLLWMLVARPGVRRYAMRLSFRMKFAGGFLAAFVTGIFVWLFLATSLTRRIAMIDIASAVIAGRTPINAVAIILSYRLRELGEIAINVPFPALPPWMQHLLPFAGATACLLVLGGLFSRRRQLGVVDIFFILRPKGNLRARI